MKSSAVTLGLALVLAPLALGKVVVNEKLSNRRHVGSLLDRRTSHKGSSSQGMVAGSDSVFITEAEFTELEVVQGLSSGPGVQLIWINLGGGAQTTVLTQTVTATQTVAGNAATQVAQGNAPPPPAVTEAGSATSVAATGATHTVVVGGAAGLVYTPSQIEAAVGDMIEFQFMSTNHTVTQSAFATPCEKLSGGMDSGFMPNANNTSPPPAMAMMVTVSTPIWFYCRQKGHCGKGMVFSVNPTAAKTAAMFQSMAIAQNGTGAATAITGGNSTGSSSSSGMNSSSGMTGSGMTSGSGSSASSSGGSSSGVMTGTGSLDGVTCTCSVVCPLMGGSAPMGVYARGGFGGMLGSLPIADVMG